MNACRRSPEMSHVCVVCVSISDANSSVKVKLNEQQFQCLGITGSVFVIFIINIRPRSGADFIHSMQIMQQSLHNDKILV